MESLKVIENYYQKDSMAYHILINHSTAVTKKALEIADAVSNFVIDKNFIKEAGMLHDIGIFLTNAPQFGCYGKDPYIRHGILGRKILEEEGYFRHAQLCENHLIISAEEIKEKKLPLPEKDMIPANVEEEIISLADKFFSKASSNLFYEKSIVEIKKEITGFGEFKMKFFDYLLKKYKIKEDEK